MSAGILYRRTQISWPTIAPLLVVGAILVPTFISAQFVAAPLIVAVVYGVILLLFATLTVTVTGDGVTASFGIGAIRKRVPFFDVESFARVRNRWVDGWGIHKYPGGTLYNASGLSAVELRLASGQTVSIGTAEPDALVAALQQATGKTEASHETGLKRQWGAQHTFAVVVTALALALAASSIYFGLQPPDVVIGFDSVYVSNGFYRNTIPYASIDAMTLEKSLPRIVLKTNGFGAGNTLRGNFRLDDWGVGRLFINRARPPFVVIRSGRDFVIVNFNEPERTNALYADLKRHLPRSPR